jgi:ATPase subunit of ABC transporter with duplicated ATPase domains
MSPALRRRIKNRIGRGLTFDKVWATIEKNAVEAREQIKKAEEQRQKEAEEDRERIRKADEQRRKDAEESKERMNKLERMIEKSHEEAEQRKKEADERQKRLDKQMGGLHNSFGELAEHLVAPGIEERFNQLGYHFQKIATRGCKMKDDYGKRLAEIDILMENGETLLAVEVKAKPIIQDIKEHIERLEVVCDFRLKNNEKRKKILGAIAGAIFEDNVRKAAREAGLFVLVQSGDTMKMDLPEGFVPREW